MQLPSSEEENSSEDEGSEEEEDEDESVPEVFTQSLEKGSDSEEDQSSPSVRRANLKRRKEKKTTGPKAAKKTAVAKPAKKPKVDVLGAPETQPLLDEKAHEKLENDGAEKKTKTAAGKREPKLFNDKNIDIDLYDSDPDKIVAKKIRLNNSVLLLCKTMETVTSTGAKQDWAAMILEKRMKDDKCYDFNMSLALVPTLIKGLEKIVQSNPQYFKKNCD